MVFHRAEWLNTVEPPRSFQGSSESAELSKLFASSNVILSSVSSQRTSVAINIENAVALPIFRRRGS